MIRLTSLTDKYPKEKLGDVVEFLDHMRRPVTKKDRIAGPHPYYGANGQQDSVEGYIFDEPLVLLAEDGGNFGDPDRTIAYQVKGKCWVNNHAHVLRPSPKIDIRYLCRHLEKYDVVSSVNGATRAKLNKSAAQKIIISLPPLEEQKRIAAILDKADALRRKREKAIALTDDLLRSTFLDMFSNPSSDWEKTSFIDVAATGRNTFVNGPFGSNLLTSELKSSGVPVIYIQDVRNGRFERKSNKYVTERKAKQLSSCNVHSGDVLIAKVGDPPGAAAVYPQNGPEGIVTQDVVRIRPNLVKVTPEFLAGFLNSEIGAKWLAPIIVEATRSRFGLGEIKKKSFNIPPLSLQKKYSEICRKIHFKRSRLIEVEQVTCTLFSSLAQRAFKGELQ